MKKSQKKNLKSLRENRPVKIRNKGRNLIKKLNKSVMASYAQSQIIMGLQKTKAIALAGRKQRKKQQQKTHNATNRKGPFGRPQDITILVQKQFQHESREYNVIIFHFSRLLIFLKIIAQRNPSRLVKMSSKYYKNLYSDSIDEYFPEFKEKPKYKYLLHPNSFHFLIKKKKEQNKIKEYTGLEIKGMMMAMLQKRQLLTEFIRTYINGYWRDIINLVNQHLQLNKDEEKGEDDQGDDQEEEDEEKDEEENEEDEEDEEDEKEDAEREMIVVDGQEVQDKQKKGKRKPPRINTKKYMQLEYSKDTSIAAYEIACYLHACCQKYDIEINCPENQNHQYEAYFSLD